ncbi:MSMEG_0567/sll0787 family protein [Frankia sp. AvcI1]|uniref:MSMEG_0567/sll0787 family protein n=1 Tax=Frankia sp. AvcI1 TaxID=573496 RepID=UPI00211836A0|nr:MSMEG_0567/sll0787 family protein [Frankia sp. AvcI1]
MTVDGAPAAPPRRARVARPVLDALLSAGAAPPVTAEPVDTLAVWGDRRTLERLPPYRIEQAGDAATLAAHRELASPAIHTGYEGSRGDDARTDDSRADGPWTDDSRADEPPADDPWTDESREDDPRTVVLIARAVGAGGDGAVLGGIRLGPLWPGPDLGAWYCDRLAVSARARHEFPGVAAALVRAAAARAEDCGVLRLEAVVRPELERFFGRLGWSTAGPAALARGPGVLMRWPIDRIAALVASCKAPLGAVLAGLRPGGPGFVGDDGAPLPGSDIVAACDAIMPTMVERDPHWAGWCGALVSINDLAAMGATPIGLLDAVAGTTASHVARVLGGLRAAADAYGVQILGGHSQFGVRAALAVTALGRAAHPVPAGGGLPGHAVSLTVDLGGGWRPGYTGRQWDSAATRRTAELQAMVRMPGRHRPSAAKDVSMAGIAGTLGMLAEASGCAAEVDVAAVPRPAGVTMGDWLTCFPGYGMITADRADRPVPPTGPAASARCGILRPGAGVTLRWPDGVRTPVLAGHITGLGHA